MGLVTACRALSFCTAVGSQSMTLEDPTRQRRFQSLDTERNRARYEYQSKIATFTSVHAPGHCIYQALFAMFYLKHAGRLHRMACSRSRPASAGKNQACFATLSWQTQLAAGKAQAQRYLQIASRRDRGTPRLDSMSGVLPC